MGLMGLMGLMGFRRRFYRPFHGETLDMVGWIGLRVDLTAFRRLRIVVTPFYETLFAICRRLAAYAL
jgi:hypothetical protein